MSAPSLIITLNNPKGKKKKKDPGQTDLDSDLHTNQQQCNGNCIKKCESHVLKHSL